MSVAFRRDSDDEHLEPRFELPIPPGPNLVTPRGYGLIKARNDALEPLYSPDLPDDERKALLRDLRYWRSRLASAQVAPPASGAIVALGTRVTIDQAGETRLLDIVGHDESEPNAGRIAYTAPLARALIGSAAGDEVEIGAGIATIRAIEPIPAST